LLLLVVVVVVVVVMVLAVSPIRMNISQNLMLIEREIEIDYLK
jgi:hypothetical protein